MRTPTGSLAPARAKTTGTTRARTRRAPTTVACGRIAIGMNGILTVADAAAGGDVGLGDEGAAASRVNELAAH